MAARPHRQLSKPAFASSIEYRVDAGLVRVRIVLGSNVPCAAWYRELVNLVALGRIDAAEVVAEIEVVGNAVAAAESLESTKTSTGEAS